MSRSWIGILVYVLAGSGLRAATHEPPNARVGRLAAPPTLDGFPSAEEWEGAATLEGFLQVEPQEASEPSERTVLRVGHDDEFLYIALFCYDSDPSGIIATQMERDARLRPDDRVEWYFDSFHDSRNAYWFQISPGGSRGDALISGNGNQFNKSWDTVWMGETAITEEGWFAEVAIPTRSIAFDPEGGVWGFNARRFIRRKNEEVRWASPYRDRRFFQISRAGDLHGFSGLHQGNGLDIKPYYKGEFLRERVEDDDRLLRFEGGGDVTWRITPKLAALFTVNTDFAETEVDDRQVNLSRFPLFFPEKREFFLEDADLFSFADARRERSFVPFFSRRVGLDDEGEAVPIKFGAKVTGRVGPYRLGILDVQTESTDTLSEKNLLAARISRDVLEESDTGVILTRGHPTQSGLNTLVGADFNFRTSTFMGGKNLRASVYGLTTSTSGEGGDGHALGAKLSYPNELWEGSVSFREIDPEFEPAMGFTRRTDVREYNGSLVYRPRPGGDLVRKFIFRIDPSLTTTTENEDDSWRVRFVPFEVEFDSGSEFRLEVIPRFETFDEPFEIQDDIEVPGDSYHTLRYGAEFESPSHHPLTTAVEFSAGEFLTGHRTDLSANVGYRPNAFFFAAVDYEINDVRLDEGDFTVRIARAQLDFTFSTKLTWSQDIQWDNVSDLVSFNSRLRFVHQDGRELFLVFNKSWLEDESTYLPQDEQLTLKLEYLFRF